MTKEEKLEQEIETIKDLCIGDGLDQHDCQCLPFDEECFEWVVETVHEFEPDISLEAIRAYFDGYVNALPAARIFLVNSNHKVKEIADTILDSYIEAETSFDRWALKDIYKRTQHLFSFTPQYVEIILKEYIRNYASNRNYPCSL